MISCIYNTENLEFRQSTADKIDLPDHSVDLIISAQAVHWFHGESFYKETKRLLRSDGLLAVWGYWTTFEDPRTQKIFNEVRSMKCRLM
jgi:ubiquinone/menaquinone biosynthesis C-methylase UbiE